MVSPQTMMFGTPPYLGRELIQSWLLCSNMGPNVRAIQKSVVHHARLRPDLIRLGMHIKLSPTKRDVIPGKVRKRKIIRYLIREMGVPKDWPYFCFFHELRRAEIQPLPGESEEHFHVAILMVNDRGQLMPNVPSPFKFLKIVERMEKKFPLEATPGLEAGNPEQIRISFRARQRYADNCLSKKDKNRLKIFFGVQDAIRHSTSGNVCDFADVLQGYGIKTIFYEAKGELCGIGFQYRGLKVSGSGLCQNFSLSKIAETLVLKQLSREANQPGVEHEKTKITEGNGHEPDPENHGHAVGKTAGPATQPEKRNPTNTRATGEPQKQPTPSRRKSTGIVEPNAFTGPKPPGQSIPVGTLHPAAKDQTPQEPQHLHGDLDLSSPAVRPPLRTVGNAENIPTEPQRDPGTEPATREQARPAGGQVSERNQTDPSRSGRGIEETPKPVTARGAVGKATAIQGEGLTGTARNDSSPARPQHTESGIQPAVDRTIVADKGHRPPDPAGLGTADTVLAHQSPAKPAGRTEDVSGPTERTDVATGKISDLGGKLVGTGGEQQRQPADDFKPAGPALDSESKHRKPVAEPAKSNQRDRPEFPAPVDQSNESKGGAITPAKRPELVGAVVGQAPTPIGELTKARDDGPGAGDKLSPTKTTTPAMTPPTKKLSKPDRYEALIHRRNTLRTLLAGLTDHSKSPTEPQREEFEKLAALIENTHHREEFTSWLTKPPGTRPPHWLELWGKGAMTQAKEEMNQIGAVMKMAIEKRCREASENAEKIMER